jgi:hypothetical protein
MMGEVPASAKEFLDEIEGELTAHKEFMNDDGRTAILTSLRLLFSDELVFSNISKQYIASFVSNVDKSMDIMLSRNLKKYGIQAATKNLLLTIIDGKLIAFLTRAIGGQESGRWYERVGRPQNTPMVR